MKDGKVFNNLYPDIKFIHPFLNNFNRVFNIFEDLNRCSQLSKNFLVTVF